MKRICNIVASMAFLNVMLFAFAGMANDNAVSEVGKWMPESPAGVAVIDLQALKVKAEYAKVKAYVGDFLSHSLTEPNELTDALAQFESGLDVYESQIDKFIAVGASKAYLFVDSRDFDNPLSYVAVIPTDSAKSNEVEKLVAEFSKGDFIPEEERENWQKAFFIKAYKNCIVLTPNFNNDDLDKEKQKSFFKQLEFRTSTAPNNPFLQKIFSEISSEKNAVIQVCFFAEGKLGKWLEKAEREVTAAGLAPSTLINGIRAIVIKLDAAKSDLRIQVVSADAQSAKALYEALPALKKLLLNQVEESVTFPEARLFIRDLINQSFILLTPEVNDNALNWSVKNIVAKLEDSLPGMNFDQSAGLYAPVTDSVKEEAARIYSLAAPFVNKQTIAVVHLDVVDLDGAFENAGEKILDELKRLLPETFSGESVRISQIVNYAEVVLKDVDNLCSQIHAVGGRDLFVIADNDPAASVKIIVPFDKEKKADAKKLFYFLRQMRFLKPDFILERESLYFKTVYKNCLIFGIKSSDSVSKDEFNQNLKAFEPEDVPEIRQAFELSWSYQRSNKQTALSRFQAILNFQAVLASFKSPLLQSLREAFEENDPELAKLLPAFTDQQLADGVKVAVVEIHPEKAFYNLHVISKDEQSARDFAEFVKALKPFAGHAYSKNIPDDAPALLKDYYLDYTDIIFDSRVLEVRDNVLSIRSNNVSEKFKALNAWYSKHGTLITIGAAGSGVAAGLLMPAVASAREAARNMHNANNLKQMALGMLVYEQAHRYLPSPYTVNAEGKRLHSWRVALLPYFDEQELYDQIRLDEPWDSEWNKQFHDKCPRVYKNPNVELAPDETTYAVVVGENTAFPGAKRINMSKIMDGCSNTVMIVERSPVCWMDPNSDIPFEEAIKGVNVSPNGIRSYFKGVFSAAMCDCAIRQFTENVSTDFLRKLLERNDGKSIDLDDPELNEQ